MLIDFSKNPLKRHGVKIAVLMLFLLFLFVQTLKFTSVPGLVGDEGYEGLSVIDHIRDTKPFFMGRETYVAFWSDYFKLPFVLTLGANTLAMRLPMLIANILTFWLSYFALKRILTQSETLFVLTTSFFSPPFILYQRISWPINFLPFFLSLLLFIATRSFKGKPLVTGFVAGLAVSTHATFIAPLFGITTVGLLTQKNNIKKLLGWWSALVGFLAGFGLQAAIMIQMNVERARVGQFSKIIDRIEIIYPTLFNYFSGIAYMGEYIGDYSHDAARIIILFLLIFIFCALFLAPKNKIATHWTISIILSVVITIFIANYFRSRYFHVTTLMVWGLAGLGIHNITKLLFKSSRHIFLIPHLLAVILSIWIYIAVFNPYLKTGGTTKNFQDSGESWDKSGHFADIQPLADCIKNIGPVYSEEPKISNRLKFLREADQHIKVTDKRKKAVWFVDYRGPRDLDDQSKIRKDEKCRAVRNFIVIPNDEYEGLQK